MLITTIWLGFIGFLDDYLKIKRKNKEGLKGKFKIIGQIILGFIVGGILYFSGDVVIRTPIQGTTNQEIVEVVDNPNCTEFVEYVDIKSTKTTIPFFKNNEFDYAQLVWFLGDNAEKIAWLVFIIATILIVTAVSNGANLTDGLDGLATGTSAIIGVTLGILAYVSGNRLASEYLHILYIPNTGELVIFISAFIGAAIGFLWYNSYPAQIFMGDTGSLTIGGIIAVFAIIIKKELLIPILCGVFLAESLSVMLQVSYFKYTKRKFGEGRRIFLMSPLHHHYQKKGYPESKIVARFWIISMMLAVISIITLKLR
jgi:phospho-N-acetylmuramoyl-pentapeptide-transferase